MKNYDVCNYDLTRTAQGGNNYMATFLELQNISTLFHSFTYGKRD